jgi:cytochrome bd-type quinol oxidase subunit 2
MKKYDIYKSIIILVKIIFILLTIVHFILQYKKNDKLDTKVVYWKERAEFVFIILMSCLLIYLFNPRKNRIHMIDKETMILLYLFGFILILTANWGLLFKEPTIFKQIQMLSGKP